MRLRSWWFLGYFSNSTEFLLNYLNFFLNFIKFSLKILKSLHFAIIKFHHPSHLTLFSRQHFFSTPQPDHYYKLLSSTFLRLELAFSVITISLYFDVYFLSLDPFSYSHANLIRPIHSHWPPIILLRSKVNMLDVGQFSSFR